MKHEVHFLCLWISVLQVSLFVSFLSRFHNKGCHMTLLLHCLSDREGKLLNICNLSTLFLKDSVFRGMPSLQKHTLLHLDFLFNSHKQDLWISFYTLSSRDKYKKKLVTKVSKRLRFNQITLETSYPLICSSNSGANLQTKIFPSQHTSSPSLELLPLSMTLSHFSLWTSAGPPYMTSCFPS